MASVEGCNFSTARKPSDFSTVIPSDFSTATPSDFSTAWRNSDVVLVVEERHLHVHKLVLSLQSDVFHVMFNHNFKEKNSIEVPLPGKSFEEIKVMLEVIYDRGKDINGGYSWVKK